MYNTIIEKKVTFLDYLKIFLFLVCCGFPCADLIPAKTYVLVLLGIVGLLAYKKTRKRLSYKPCIITLVFTWIVAAMHYVKYGVVDITLLKISVAILAGFLTMASMGEHFRYTLFKMMYWLCLISIVGFVLMRIMGIVLNVDLVSRPDFPGIFLWGVRDNEILLGRNCGPFWEPGAFAGYIIITFSLFFMDLEDLWAKRKKECLVMAVALVTTFSTQGYLTAFVFLVFKYLQRTNNKRIIVSTISGCFFLMFAYILYQEVPFLSEKVNEQLMLASSWDDEASLRSANRFTTTMVDYYNIQKEPLWGRTHDSTMLYEDFSTIMWAVDRGGYGTGSGISNYAASNGVLIIIIWLVLSFKSFAVYYGSKKTAMMLMLMFCFLGQAELYIGYIFYQSFPFLRYTKT